jgi:hypothetical protein
MMIMQYARDEACTSHLAFFSYLTDLSNYLKLNKCFLCSLPASTSSSPPHLLLLLPAHCTRKTLLVREVLVDARWTRHLQQTLSSNAVHWDLDSAGTYSAERWRPRLGDLEVGWMMDPFRLHPHTQFSSKVQPAAVFSPWPGNRIPDFLVSLSVASVIADNPLKHAGLAISCAWIMPEISVHIWLSLFRSRASLSGLEVSPSVSLVVNMEGA